MPVLVAASETKKHGEDLRVSVIKLIRLRDGWTEDQRLGRGMSYSTKALLFFFL